ncbi:MAG: ABC transporter ATP-binding protein [Eubacteriales bacterium]|nr:ABC transporter ATP-binding protein [Eubacteriales bacterium]
MSLLEIKNCTICYQNGRPAVSEVSLSVSEGEIVSIVGESGSGKTTLIRAVLGLLPPGGKITEGQILFNGKDLVKASEQEMQDIRGREIAMIFQDVGAALDPIQRISRQYGEAIAVHEKLPRQEYRKRAVSMLKRMHLTDTERVMDSYPFELSGGMKQRVGIAMGMNAQPKLLLADEPTSALDVTIQAQVVHEMKQLREKYGTTIILVTHNMGVASYLSDKIGVMCQSRMVEFGSRDEIIYHPKEPYTQKLLEAVPKLGGRRFAK